MSVALYINNEVLDLPFGTQIAYTYKNIDIGDITSRYASYTNSIKALKTINNSRILNFAEQVDYGTTSPYTKMSAYVIQDGVEMINGYAYVKESYDYYMIQVYDTPIEFATVLGEKTIDELDTGDVDTNTTAVKYPQINYGDVSRAGDQSTIDETLYASFQYKELIQRIYTANGFIVEGDVLSRTKFTNTYLAGLGFGGYNSVFKSPREKYQYRVGDYTQGMNGSWFTVVWSVGAGIYTVPSAPDGVYASDYYEVKIEVRIDAQLTNGAGDVCTCEIYHSRLGSTLIADFTNNSRTTITQVVTRNCRVGDQIYVRYRRITIGGTFTVYDGSFCKITVTSTVFSAYRNIQGLLPNTKQIDVIKDFYNTYGIIPIQLAGRITLKTFDELIINPSETLDWRPYRTAKVDRIYYSYKTFAQQNYFRYDKADSLTNDDYGASYIAVENENLPLKTEIYKSIVCRTLTEQLGNSANGFVYGAYIPIWEGGAEKNDPKFRLILIRAKLTEEVVASGVTQVGYFLDESRDSLHWEDNIAENYSNLTYALKNPKIVEREYILNPHEVKKVTPHTVILDEGKFIPLEITNYVPDKPAKVKLLKL